jgi:hypothetical protein
MITKIIASVVSVVYVATLLYLAACSPKVQKPVYFLAIGQTYKEAKVACPDLANRAFDRDDKSAVVLYLCPSQNVVVVGDLRTAKVVGLLMTPERQTFLRDSVATTILNRVD